MSGIRVSPEDLKALATLIADQGEHADEARRHLLRHTGVVGGEGWLGELLGLHEALRDDAAAWLEALAGNAFDPAASAMRAAADDYVAADAAAAAEFGVNAETDEEGLLTEVSDPGADLRSPEDHTAKGAWRTAPAWSDQAAVGSQGRAAVLRATEVCVELGRLDRAVDLDITALEPLRGDWAGFRGCADVYRGAADLCRDIEDNVDRARTALPETWSGAGAESCEEFLGAVAPALSDGGEQLDGLAAAYESAAQAAFDFSDAAAETVAELIDASVVLAVALAGGNAAASDGTLVGCGVAAYEAKAVAAVVGDLLEARENAEEMMDAARVELEARTADGPAAPAFPGS
jgi:uncharacterized protein YukE